MTLKLTGAVAIVTGASSGIGEATARRLAEAGASVALVARRKDRLDALVAGIEEAGGTAFAVPADIAEQAQAEVAVQAVVDRFGRVDILINNAGLMLIGPIVGADVAEWERMLAINVRGLLYVTHAALPHLRPPRPTRPGASPTSSTSARSRAARRRRSSGSTT